MTTEKSNGFKMGTSSPSCFTITSETFHRARQKHEQISQNDDLSPNHLEIDTFGSCPHADQIPSLADGIEIIQRMWKHALDEINESIKRFSPPEDSALSNGTAQLQLILKVDE